MPQSLSKVYIHIVFSTKKGYRYIDEEIRPKLQGYIVGIFNNLRIVVKEIYANPDHIHILCTLPRILTIAEIVNKIKSNSSRWIKAQNVDHFKWQDGYGVFSVSKSELGKVQDYIRFQNKHHDTVSYKEEMRQFFEEFDVEYDEQYVWD